jgi:hypothetical protein
VAGLVPVDLLLGAFEASEDDRYLGGALDTLEDFARYERRVRLPEGFLWNDHAVGNRVFVLSDLWAAYRRHAAFTPETGRTILELAARSGEFLTSPAQLAMLAPGKDLRVCIGTIVTYSRLRGVTCFRAMSGT